MNNNTVCERVCPVSGRPFDIRVHNIYSSEKWQFCKCVRNARQIVASIQ